MKLSELMTNYTPNADYEGWVTNDDYVFAINLTPETANTAVTDFAVVEMGIAGLDAQLNPITQDKTYIRAGQNTMKSVSGMDRERRAFINEMKKLYRIRRGKSEKMTLEQRNERWKKYVRERMNGK